MSRTHRMIATMTAASLAASLLTVFAVGAPSPANATPVWNAAWGASTQESAPLTASNFTCRNVARVTASGTSVRVRLSNALVGESTTFSKVTIAKRSTGGGTVAGTSVALTFGGSTSTTVAPGQQAVSDAAAMTVGAGDDLAVSIYFSGAISAFANHAVGLATQYCTAFDGTAGDHTGDTSTASFPGSGTNIPWVTGIDVSGNPVEGTVVAFGDSITDGFGSTVNGNSSWPSQLAGRLVSASRNVGVVNSGISGNTITTAGGVGPTGADRFDRDVLQIPGVRSVILADGSNDIALGATAASITSAIKSLVDRAHAAGVRAIGATLIPRHNGWGGGDAAKDAVRDAVNSYIRTSGIFDGLVDFDAATRDPSAPSSLKPSADSGDHVHPSDAGYAAMASAVDLGSLLVTAPSISVDAAGNNGIVSKDSLGQMAEVGTSNMNGAWAQKLVDRSLESDSVGRSKGFYDTFTGSAVDRSLWTPTRLDAGALGTLAVSSSQLSVTASSAGRFGALSNDIPRSVTSGTSIEARITAYTGQNALVSAYGGTGAGDFSHNVEFGVEAGKAVVYADGLASWVGSAVTLPADFRITVSPDAARTIDFYVNDALVHTITGYTALPAPYRAFLYGYSGTASFDRINVTSDDTYDSFGGSALASRWTPTRLQGATNGTTSVSGGQLTVTGGAASRFGVLSDYLQNSSVDWTSVSARLTAQSGTNALLDIYGGTGSFDKFVEFGVEGGVAKVFTSSGPGGWTGPAVTLPATLEVQVSTYWANGRNYRFLINGTPVYELKNMKDVPAGDFRAFLYGYGASTTTWDSVSVAQKHVGDLVVNTFDDDGALNGLWTGETLEGGYGSVTQTGGRVVVTGAAASRYGVLSKPIPDSDIYGYSLEAKLDSVSGTNGLFDIYGGTGRGDFSHNVEFGVEGGVLKVYGAGLPTFTGGAVTLPARLRVDVSAPTGAGARNLDFFLNDRLVHSYEGTTVLGTAPYRTFMYGYGTSTTAWDYRIANRIPATWQADGYASRATYTHARAAAKTGAYGERITTTDSSGRRGISQSGLNVVTGHQYQVTVWLKGTSGPATIYLGPGGSDGPGYAPYATATTASVSTSTLTKYTVTLTPSTSDTRAKLFIGTAGTGTLDIDLPSLMPLHSSEATLGGWRTDFVDELQAMKTTSIRWPGGIIADWYHWADGIGDRDSRPPTYYGEWDPEWIVNDVGTHEILDLAASLGISVDLNVNWGTGTPAEAANWVHYTNDATNSTRAANGRTAPWGVRNWGVGNETWGFWTPGWTSDANAFATSYKTFADAMRAADGSIELMADGDDGSQPGQVRNLALLAKGSVDHLAEHIYAPQTLPQGYDDAAVFRASNAVPAILADFLAGTEQAIVQNTSVDVKAAITEYSPNYLHDPTTRVQSLEAGLQVGGMVNYFLRRPDLLEINDISGLVNLWEGGGIRLGERGTFFTPSHYVMSMEANHLGSVLLPTQVASDTFSTPALGNMPAKSGVPYLDVTTTKSADGKKIFLSVVNRSATLAMPTPISLTGAGTLSSTASVYTLNSASYLDKNTAAAPTTVAPQTSTITGVSSSFSYTFPAHSVTIIELGATASATTGSVISGYVYDQTTLAALPGATVTVSGGASVTTGAGGRYLVSVPGPGTYSITVSAPGHSAKTRTNIEVEGLGATANSIPLGP